jgi:hypothetical protein
VLSSASVDSPVSVPGNAKPLDSNHAPSIIVSEMRFLVRATLLAAVLVAAGCNPFGRHDAQIARITYISAPDTAFVGSRFQTTVTAFLGPDSGYVLDHYEVTTRPDAKLTVRVWSRDTASVRRHGGQAAMFKVTLNVTPTESGRYRIIGYEPNGNAIQKSVTVLP